MDIIAVKGMNVMVMAKFPKYEGVYCLASNNLRVISEL
jgi:hypothetical protein